ncbi:Nif3-like dinuclear metal center hexameric protein [Hymenobacter sp. BT770]|uniref:Nif3-like dinuclear metal center hexameric protein n=1 Tax=Hymenobacter sp. BT770 TaxID=2886942 RepID=UPI001D12B8B0|nr:Nif3-like dinuclear metal center hexameric protein [Hymenobacter sp. BT770]MCC3154542.1 Nif3-like dinuclear metal center hexameric protein [Hymenobacter sp. BT770]MDO3416596.1 Nif3-like dinuclear metal center hexameric protein [Hymenobacter sp. BT770]
MKTPTVQDLARLLEAAAPLAYQESYDNAGLQCGDPQAEVKGVLISLDCTPAVIAEALRRGCNVVVCHHPVIFRPLKRLTGANEVEQTLIAALKNDVAIYAAHTNLDNVRGGVNDKLAEKLGLTKTRVLAPQSGTLARLITYVPHREEDQQADVAGRVRAALYAAGAGQVGQYSECSFQTLGTGTFTPGAGTQPAIGAQHQPETVPELRLEVLLPLHRQAGVLRALRDAHPYEEVAYELIKLENTHQEVGAGLVGELPVAMAPAAFRAMLKQQLLVPVVRFTPFEKDIKTVAICGGAGAFLIGTARAAGADAYVTGDVKYHEFFGAEGQLMLCDVGHFESEQFTGEVFRDLLTAGFERTFAVLIAETPTNPVQYDC